MSWSLNKKNTTKKQSIAMLTGLKCRQTSLPHPSIVYPRGTLVLVHIEDLQNTTVVCDDNCASFF